MQIASPLRVIRLIALLFLLAGPFMKKAEASLWSYSNSNVTGENQGAGNIKSISATYDDTAHRLTYSVTIAAVNGTIADGFWVTLTDGASPAYSNQQLPVFYFDASRSFNSSGSYNGTSAYLTAYGYNGKSSTESYSSPGVGLMSNVGSTSNWLSGNTVSVSGNSSTRTFSFSVDTTYLDDPAWVKQRYQNEGYSNFSTSTWEGAGFGSNIGIVMGTYDITDSDYYGKYLSCIESCNEGSLKITNATTTKVPEPGSALLLAVGAAVLMRRRRHGGLKAASR